MAITRGARLGRLLHQGDLEAGSNGMVEKAKRVAEFVGFDHQNVAATCRKAEMELFGACSTEVNLEFSISPDYVQALYEGRGEVSAGQRSRTRWSPRRRRCQRRWRRILIA